MNEIITLPAPPEIDLERAQKAIDAAVDTIKQTIHAIVENFVPVINVIIKDLARVWDTVRRAVVPPKWWHLYKYAKKARTRKKYARKIRDAVAAALAGSES